MAGLDARQARHPDPSGPRRDLSCNQCFGACRYQHDRSTWPTCWECGHIYGDVIDTFVPITYSVDGGLESMLHQYKDGGTQWLRRPLASLLTAFVCEHADCIEQDARGIDLATTVPSDNQSRSFNHLDRLLRGAIQGDPIINRFRWQTDAVVRDSTTTRPRRRELKPSAYRVDNYSVDGASVLLLDDTWTSGSSAASTAAALKDAGALRVTVLTLGRQLNQDRHFGSTDAIYDDCHSQEWTPDGCVLCA